MTGDSIIWGAMGALVLIAVFAHGLRLLRSRLSPPVETWSGHIVAVLIQMADDSYTSAVLIRRTDQPLEATIFVGGAGQLPRAVKEQVFRPSLGAVKPSPYFNISDEALPDAVAQARRGGYRFELAYPVPVIVTRDARGQLDWHLVSDS